MNYYYQRKNKQRKIYYGSKLMGAFFCFWGKCVSSYSAVLHINFAINYFAIKMYEILQQKPAAGGGQRRRRSREGERRVWPREIDINFSVSRVII
jgi:hypothetical protein